MWGYDQVINQHLRGINGMIGGHFPICLDDSGHFLVMNLDK